MQRASPAADAQAVSRPGSTRFVQRMRRTSRLGTIVAGMRENVPSRTPVPSSVGADRERTKRMLGWEEPWLGCGKTCHQSIQPNSPNQPTRVGGER